MESFNAAAYQIVPTKDYLEMNGWFMTMLQFLVFIVFYCDKGAQIVFNTIMLSLKGTSPMFQMLEVDKLSVII